MELVFSPEWWICALVLLVGCSIQTAIGFGMAVLAAPVVMLVAPEWVPYVLSTTALVTSGINSWYLKTHVSVSSMAPAVLARVPGTVIGIWLLLVMDLMWLQVVVSVAVLLAVIVSLFPLKFEATTNRLAWAGFASGFMGTTTSIGGPPMALVMQHGNPEKIRANLSLYFVFACLLSMSSYGLAGLINGEIGLVCLSFTPVAVAGFFFGKRIQSRIEAKTFRYLLLALCAVSSVIALTGVLVIWLTA